MKYIYLSGAHIRGGVGGCNTSPALENCKKSVQNSLKIVEKVGPSVGPQMSTILNS